MRNAFERGIKLVRRDNNTAALAVQSRAISDDPDAATVSEVQMFPANDFCRYKAWPCLAHFLAPSSHSNKPRISIGRLGRRTVGIVLWERELWFAMRFLKLSNKIALPHCRFNCFSSSWNSVGFSHPPSVETNTSIPS